MSRLPTNYEDPTDGEDDGGVIEHLQKKAKTEDLAAAQVARGLGNFTVTNKRELAEYGYTIIRNVISAEDVEFAKQGLNDWVKSMTGANMADPSTLINKSKALPSALFSHGVAAHYAGHTRAGWFLRMHPQILNVWCDIYGGAKKGTTIDDLVVSLDGFGITPSNYAARERKIPFSELKIHKNSEASRTKYWDHVDLGSGLSDGNGGGLQSLINLDAVGTKDASFMVRPGSHKHHAEFVRRFKIGKGNFHMLNTQEKFDFYEKEKGCALVKLAPLLPGDMVVWHSSTVHCNSEFEAHDAKDIRLRRVVYLSYDTKSALQAKDVAARKDAFRNINTTTSHWAARGYFSANGKPHYFSKADEDTFGWRRPAGMAMLHPHSALNDLSPEIVHIYRSLGMGFDDVKDNKKYGGCSYTAKQLREEIAQVDADPFFEEDDEDDDEDEDEDEDEEEDE
jgi:hypothetical protein